MSKPQIGYSDGAGFISCATFDNIPTPPMKSDLILGYTYGYMANRGDYRSPRGIQSQNLMYELNNNWVCLAVANYQEHFYSTEIHADYMRTPTDRDIEDFVKRAHEQNVKVCLKPMLNSEDNMWRAHIGFPDLNMSDMDIYWNKWFESYKQYILYYAELAQELHCEMLCIGCEMLGTEHRKYEWLHIIDEVRKIYSGKIVYNTNHDHEDSVEWFDVLDYIGTSAYYPVGGESLTYDEMMKNWLEVKYRLDAIAESRHKKFIFMEIGCRSVAGASSHPWDFTEQLPWNEKEQADFYRSCFDTFIEDKNFAGVFWWDWPTFVYNDRIDAEKDKGFSIHLKEAEKVVKNYYGKYRWK